MKKIFLPVDGSEHSRRAVRQAVDIARLSGGEARVFHFQEREPSKAGVATFETTDEAAKIVDDAVAELHGAQIKASGETRAGLTGEAAKTIVDEAARFDADRDGLARTLRLRGGRGGAGRRRGIRLDPREHAHDRDGDNGGGRAGDDQPVPDQIRPLPLQSRAGRRELDDLRGRGVRISHSTRSSGVGAAQPPLYSTLSKLCRRFRDRATR